MIKKPKWHSGPPPSVGWWPASFFFFPGAIRWWDGERWSVAAEDGYTAMEAAECAALPEVILPGEVIRWTDRPADWPKKSKT